MIENVLGFEKAELKNRGVVKEKTYSVFRQKILSNTKVWHIHGEINSPRSILLGYEHYSGQLQHIRNYVILGARDEYKNFRSNSLISLIKKRKEENNSWLDLFFSKDIYIVGLTLDFVEIDLWWLITHRARAKLEMKLPIKNAIKYYYPEKYSSKINSKLRLLEANEIIPVSIGHEHNLDYYNDVFINIKND